MKHNTGHIILYSIRTFLMVFWLYVSMDKLWEPNAFRAALLRQPFPDSWTDVLYWLLPAGELVLGLLFEIFIILFAVLYHTLVFIRKRFPRRFALFPGRPVRSNLNYTFVACP